MAPRPGEETGTEEEGSGEECAQRIHIQTEHEEEVRLCVAVVVVVGVLLSWFVFLRS